MKVIFLNDSMCGGGAERAMANIVNVLSKSMEIDLIALEDSFCIPLEPAIKRYSFNRHIHSKLKKFFGLIIDAYRLKKFVKKHQHHTVVSFQYRSNFINIIATLLGSRHRAIVSERNYPERSLAYLPFFQFLLKRLYPLADCVVCNASDTKILLEQEYGLQNVELIFNGYNKEEILSHAKEAIPEEYQTIFAKDVILTAGRLTRQKGQSDLLRAFAKLQKGYHLVLLGEGEDYDLLSVLAKELQIEKRVFFLGYQKNPYPFIKAAKVFVFPSLYEGFPNALSEALICQTAVVSYNFKSGANDLIDVEELVSIGDIDALVTAINHAKVLQDTTLPISEVATAYATLLSKEKGCR